MWESKTDRERQICSPMRVLVLTFLLFYSLVSVLLKLTIPDTGETFYIYFNNTKCLVLRRLDPRHNVIEIYETNSTSLDNHVCAHFMLEPHECAIIGKNELRQLFIQT